MRVSILGFLLAATSAVQGVLIVSPDAPINLLVNSLTQNFAQQTTEIHFGVKDQDHGGMLLIRKKKPLVSDELITIGDAPWVDQAVCSELLQGYYRTALNGSEQLLPLSDEDWSIIGGAGGDLEIEGGLMTSCTPGGLTVSAPIFGGLKYKDPDGGNIIRQVQAGRELNYDENGILGHSSASHSTYLIPNFVLYNQFTARPLGLINDSKSGIGFVGGYMDGLVAGSGAEGEETKEEIIDNLGKTIVIDDLFPPVNNADHGQICFKYTTGPGDPAGCFTLFRTGILDTNIAIHGVAGLSRGNAQDQNDYTKTLQTLGATTDVFDRKTIFVGSEIDNIGNVLNTARRNREFLCGGKWEKNHVGEINVANIQSQYCVDQSQDISIAGVATQPISIYIKGGADAIVRDNQHGNGYITLFVDEGNIGLAMETPVKTTKGGKVNHAAMNAIAALSYTAAENENTPQGFYLRGNYMTNGIMAAYDRSKHSDGITNNEFGPFPFNRRLYVVGTMAAYNTLADPRNERVTLIRQNLPLFSNVAFDTYISPYVNVNNLFTRACSDYGRTNEPTPVRCEIDVDEYATKTFIVIKDEQIRNELLQ